MSKDENDIVTTIADTIERVSRGQGLENMLINGLSMAQKVAYQAQQRKIIEDKVYQLAREMQEYIDQLNELREIE